MEDNKSFFPTSWTWPLSTVTCFYLHVVGRKPHTEIFNWLAGHEPRPSMPVGRTAPASTNIRRLDTGHCKHWPGHSPTKQRCCVCSVRGVTRTVMFRSVKCDVAPVWTEIVLQNTTQRTTYETSFHPSFVQTVEALTTVLVKEQGYLQVS